MLNQTAWSWASSFLEHQYLVPTWYTHPCQFFLTYPKFINPIPLFFYSVLRTITRKFDHITPVLRDQLHWLPIRQRIDFKIAVFVYNALHGRGPAYLSRTCNPVREVGARAHLRSAVRGDLTVPRTRTRRFGPRSFRVSGPVIWNSLPEDIRAPELSLERFKSMLKTHLFRHAYA